MATKDVFAEGLGVKFLALDIVTWKAVLGVGDQDSAIRSTLHGTKDTRTSGGTFQADIEEAFERASILAVDLCGFGQVVLAFGILDASEGFVESEFFEDAAGDKETSSVGGSPIGKAMFNAIGAEFMRVGGAKNLAVIGISYGEVQASVVSTYSPVISEVTIWQMISRLVKRTTRRYLGALYLFLAWVMRRLRA